MMYWRLLLITVVSFCLLSPSEAWGQKRKQKKNAEEQRAWPVLAREESLEELPAALIKETPFEVESLYAIPPSQNREQLYNRIWFLIDVSGGSQGMSESWRVDPEGLRMLTADRELVKRTKKTKRALIELEKLRKSTIAFDRGGELGELEPREQKKAKRILKDLQWVLDDLRSASEKRDACFVRTLNRRRWGWPTYFADELDRIARLWYLANPDDMELDLMKSLLQAHRDLVPLGKRASSLERLVLDPFAERFLASCETEEEVDRLIKVILEHREKQKELVPFLESAKATFLERCLRLLLVRDKVYMNELNPRSTGAGPGHHATQYFPLYGIGYYLKNKDIAKQFKELRELEEANWVDFEKKIVDDLEKKAIDRQLDFEAMVLQLSQEDIAREIAIEKQRYLEIAAAIKLPAKDRDAQLEKLSTVWTLDGSWKKSVFRLFDFRPRPMIDNRLGVCESSMALSLAALVKFRIAHKGETPKDLAQAFAFARCGPVPEDPFNGKPLQMRIVGRKFGVTSVGPDGIGDEVVGDDGKRRKKKRSDDRFVWIEVEP